MARDLDIVSVIKQQIEEFDVPTTMVDVGYVTEASDGIARIHGLSGCKASELLEFPGGIMGIALNLEEDNVGVAILGDYTHIKEGDEVRSTGRVSEVPVGENLLGRVVDPIGEPLDGKGPIGASKTRPIEYYSPHRDKSHR
jgi:F-type H+-transporting ATPase subunit alpha